MELPRRISDPKAREIGHCAPLTSWPSPHLESRSWGSCFNLFVCSFSHCPVRIEKYVFRSISHIISKPSNYDVIPGRSISYRRRIRYFHSISNQFISLSPEKRLLNLSKGIGRATAVSFALEGCHRIAICDRNIEGLVETEKCMKEVSSYAEILKIKVDMLEEEEIHMMVHETVTKWGRVDYAVNAAGSSPSSLSPWLYQTRLVGC